MALFLVVVVKEDIPTRQLPVEVMLEMVSASEMENSISNVSLRLKLTFVLRTF